MVQKFDIEGLALIEPRVFEDERGYFFESYNQDFFNREVADVQFLQDNQSLSAKGVLRGLHFQAPPYDQGKLVRVIKGAVIDVAVDIRKSSPTFGQHVSVELSEKNQLIFWIPAGFAHGFLSLEDDTIFSYKCTNVYHAASEGAIKYDDPQIDIDWGIENPLVSEKDLEAALLENFSSPFE